MASGEKRNMYICHGDWAEFRRFAGPDCSGERLTFHCCEKGCQEILDGKLLGAKDPSMAVSCIDLAELAKSLGHSREKHGYEVSGVEVQVLLTIWAEKQAGDAEFDCPPEFCHLLHDPRSGRIFPEEKHRAFHKLRKIRHMYAKHDYWEKYSRPDEDVFVGSEFGLLHDGKPRNMQDHWDDLHEFIWDVHQDSKRPNSRRRWLEEDPNAPSDAGWEDDWEPEHTEWITKHPDSALHSFEELYKEEPIGVQRKLLSQDVDDSDAVTLDDLTPRKKEAVEALAKQAVKGLRKDGPGAGLDAVDPLLVPAQVISRDELERVRAENKAEQDGQMARLGPTGDAEFVRKQAEQAQIVKSDKEARKTKDSADHSPEKPAEPLGPVTKEDLDDIAKIRKELKDAELHQMKAAEKRESPRLAERQGVARPKGGKLAPLLGSPRLDIPSQSEHLAAPGELGFHDEVSEEELIHEKRIEGLEPFESPAEGAAAFIREDNVFLEDLRAREERRNRFKKKIAGLGGHTFIDADQPIRTPKLPPPDIQQFEERAGENIRLQRDGSLGWHGPDPQYVRPQEAGRVAQIGHELAEEVKTYDDERKEGKHESVLSVKNQGIIARGLPKVGACGRQAIKNFAFKTLAAMYRLKPSRAMFGMLARSVFNKICVGVRNFFMCKPPEEIEEDILGAGNIFARKFHLFKWATCSRLWHYCPKPPESEMQRYSAVVSKYKATVLRDTAKMVQKAVLRILYEPIRVTNLFIAACVKPLIKRYIKGAGLELQVGIGLLILDLTISAGAVVDQEGRYNIYAGVSTSFGLSIPETPDEAINLLRKVFRFQANGGAFIMGRVTVAKDMHGWGTGYSLGGKLEWGPGFMQLTGEVGTACFGPRAWMYAFAGAASDLGFTKVAEAVWGGLMGMSGSFIQSWAVAQSEMTSQAWGHNWFMNTFMKQTFREDETESGCKFENAGAKIAIGVGVDGINPLEFSTGGMFAVGINVASKWVKAKHRFGLRGQIDKSSEDWDECPFILDDIRSVRHYFGGFFKKKGKEMNEDEHRMLEVPPVYFEDWAKTQEPAVQPAEYPRIPYPIVNDIPNPKVWSMGLGIVSGTAMDQQEWGAAGFGVHQCILACWTEPLCVAFAVHRYAGKLAEAQDDPSEPVEQVKPFCILFSDVDPSEEKTDTENYAHSVLRPKAEWNREEMTPFFEMQIEELMANSMTSMENEEANARFEANTPDAWVEVPLLDEYSLGRCEEMFFRWDMTTDQFNQIFQFVKAKRKWIQSSKAEVSADLAYIEESEAEAKQIGIDKTDPEAAKEMSEQYDLMPINCMEQTEKDIEGANTMLMKDNDYPGKVFNTRFSNNQLFGYNSGGALTNVGCDTARGTGCSWEEAGLAFCDTVQGQCRCFAETVYAKMYEGGSIACRQCPDKHHLVPPAKIVNAGCTPSSPSIKVSQREENGEAVLGFNFEVDGTVFCDFEIDKAIYQISGRFEVWALPSPTQPEAAPLLLKDETNVNNFFLGNPGPYLAFGFINGDKNQLLLGPEKTHSSEMSDLTRKSDFNIPFQRFNQDEALYTVMRIQLNQKANTNLELKGFEIQIRYNEKDMAEVFLNHFKTQPGTVEAFNNAISPQGGSDQETVEILAREVGSDTKRVYPEGRIHNGIIPDSRSLGTDDANLEVQYMPGQRAAELAGDAAYEQQTVPEFKADVDKEIAHLMKEDGLIPEQDMMARMSLLMVQGDGRVAQPRSASDMALDLEDMFMDEPKNNYKVPETMKERAQFAAAEGINLAARAHPIIGGAIVAGKLAGSVVRAVVPKAAAESALSGRDGAQSAVSDGAQSTPLENGAHSSSSEDGVQQSISEVGAQSTVSDDGAQEDVSEVGAHQAVSEDGTPLRAEDTSPLKAETEVSSSGTEETSDLLYPIGFATLLLGAYCIISVLSDKKRAATEKVPLLAGSTP